MTESEPEPEPVEEARPDAWPDMHPLVLPLCASMVDACTHRMFIGHMVMIGHTGM